MEGGFSKALLMRKENESEVVAKIPCQIAGPAGLTTASEVGVLEYCMSSFALSSSLAHVVTDGTGSTQKHHNFGSSGTLVVFRQGKLRRCRIYPDGKGQWCPLVPNMG